jgi:hypothetical protein
MSNDDATWTDHRDELFERVVQQGRARKRRRALTAAGVVVMVGAVAAFGLYAPSRGRDSLHVANDPNRGTTTTLPARPGGVLLIGDQVMLGAKSALVQTIPEARVDASVSRQFGQATAIVNADKHDGALPPAVVIALGTNGPSEGDVFDRVTTEFKAVMGAIGSTSTVYFVTVTVPRPWESEVNAALYSAAPAFPNAHVLAWKDHSGSHAGWFLADGIHLTSAGQVAYAAFIRDGIRTPDATYSDPFAGRAIPTTGLLVTDDAKGGGEHASPSYTMELYDEAGNDLGPLPRAVIDYRVTNAVRHELVVTDGGIHLEPLPVAPTTDEPSGCTPTEKDDALAVADCGARFGDQVLGDRIVANDGSGWAQVVGKPPVQGGSPLVGHWVWAWPSPNGRWLLAAWSAECEVPMGLFVSVADGSVRAVTGEEGVAWRRAPESGALGWSADGSAMVVLGGESACGGSAPVPRGISLVSPDTGARRLLLPLTPSQGVLTWSAVDDQRTRPPGTGRR